MRTYGQYCPIALAAEVFAQRWTPIIIRNLHLGCGHFGDILDGAPGLPRRSPASTTSSDRRTENAALAMAARSHAAPTPSTGNTRASRARNVSVGRDSMRG